MKTLTLKNKFQTNATLLPNDFIDNYMVNANGEFVKVYLFLLRHLDDVHCELTLSMIADCLNNTEKDILRAFRYWESEGLLCLERDSDDKIVSIELQKFSSDQGTSSVTNSMPVNNKSTNIPSHTTVAETATPSIESSSSAPVPSAAPATKAVDIDEFRAQKEIKSLIFIAEQYLGKTLTLTEVETITYFYDTLHMSANLIEYLIETCVENGHTSIHYIKKVAFSWHENGIDTVSQAKEQTMLYSQSGYAVLNAFGIKGRGLASSELNFVKKWSQQYAFSTDIIEEACRRTLSATHQPSFEYADTILTKWHQNHIRHLQDISSLDEAYQKEILANKNAAKSKVFTKNLNNFERRDYDMASLEEKLLKSN